MSLNRSVVAWLAASILSGAAVAAPLQYTFSTSTGPAGAANAGDIVALLGANARVTGSFVYNNGGSLLGNSGALGADPGYTVYMGNTPATISFGSLAGSVAGHNFSDPSGGVAVGNNVAFPPSVVDVVSLLADPSVPSGAVAIPERPRQIKGFTIGDYTLHNVRVVWAAPSFYLASDALPSQLPAFNGTLNLDFVRTDDLGNANSGLPYHSRTVYFQGLHVQAVPEPATWAMGLSGLMLVGATAVRRRRSGKQG
jgi:hypothetical protein